MSANEIIINVTVTCLNQTVLIISDLLSWDCSSLCLTRILRHYEGSYCERERFHCYIIGTIVCDCHDFSCPVISDKTVMMSHWVLSHHSKVNVLGHL